MNNLIIFFLERGDLNNLFLIKNTICPLVAIIYALFCMLIIFKQYALWKSAGLWVLTPLISIGFLFLACDFLIPKVSTLVCGNIFEVEDPSVQVFEKCDYVDGILNLKVLYPSLKIYSIAHHEFRYQNTIKSITLDLFEDPSAQLGPMFYTNRNKERILAVYNNLEQQLQSKNNDD
jgi:hypothetical protein